MYDDAFINPETKKALTPEELKELIKVADKLTEVTSRRSSEPKREDQPWDGS